MWSSELPRNGIKYLSIKYLLENLSSLESDSNKTFSFLEYFSLEIGPLLRFIKGPWFEESCLKMLAELVK